MGISDMVQSKKDPLGHWRAHVAAPALCHVQSHGWSPLTALALLSAVYRDRLPHSTPTPATDGSGSHTCVRRQSPGPALCPRHVSQSKHAKTECLMSDQHLYKNCLCAMLRSQLALLQYVNEQCNIP